MLYGFASLVLKCLHVAELHCGHRRLSLAQLSLAQAIEDHCEENKLLQL